MVDLHTDFVTSLNNVLAASDGSMDELNAINHAILTGEGIDQIIESFAEDNPVFAQALKNNKDKLKKPDVALNELMESNIEIPKELAEKLGFDTSKANETKVTVNIGAFSQAAFKQQLNEPNNTLGLGNLNSETVDLLCLLLCQGSKEEIIETLKATLKSKIHERANLSNEYQEKSVNMVNEQIEAQKAEEKAKRLSVLTAILSAVLAVVITVISVATTVATGGASALMIAGAALAVMSAIASIASSACTISAIYSDNPDVKEKLNSAATGLGIASAVLGVLGGGAEIVGSITTSAAKIGTKAASVAATKMATNISEEAIKKGAEAAGKVAAETIENVLKNGSKNIGKDMLKEMAKNSAKEAAKSAAKEALKESGEKITEETAEKMAEEMAEEMAKKATEAILKNDLVKTLENIGNIVTVGSAVIEGTTQIVSGVRNLEYAETQRSLEDIKIEMAKLDQEIETLVAFIDGLTKDIQKFMEDFLKNEQDAVEALHAKNDTESQIVSKIA